MPNAFELLTEHSTAPSGSTAWEHLNAQEGGGGGTGDVYIAEMVTMIDDDEILTIRDEDQDLVFSDDDNLTFFELNDSELERVVNDELGVVEL